ncbi:hypothetical protein F4604DRAFT_1878695 [Suillus subluteus]|nr:hypothetical protein F4604DRAFT_1878695 [Suillus subluteus]
MSDVDIVRHLKDHYDQEEYGLSIVSFCRMRNSWGWKWTRQQQHTLESIKQHVQEIRRRFPHQGAEAIRRDLRQQFSFHVPHELIAKLLKITEPNAVEARRRGRLKQRRFWCVGVNDVWPQDQHDKWLCFGLWLHISLNPFTGWINWLKVWWTNKNPRPIARYYLDCCRKLGAVPLITQSDPGSENFSVANAQTMIRHCQHSTNTSAPLDPEIMWSVLRRDFAPGFKNILEEGVTRGLYDVNNTLKNYVFRWLAIPWLQAELDGWAHCRNHNAPCRDKNKILPHGIPAIIRMKPREFNSLDFKVPVPSALFDEVEAIYAPPDHPVFDLVPPSFKQHAQYLYTSLGKPQVSSDSFWNVYQMLLAQFLAIEGEDGLIVLLSQGVMEPEDEDVLLLLSLQDLPQNTGLVGPAGYQYMGGMVNPLTQALHGVQDWGPQGEHQDNEDQPEFAEFTDSESESDGPK